MGWREALNAAAARLAPVGDTPRLDAELLMAHAAGIERTALLLRGLDEVPPGFEALVTRRLRQEPVAYLTGTRDFWTITLAVTRDVLIPRPDSETLIEAAVAHFAGTAGPRRVLDLGTGSGALLLAALAQWPATVGLGVDASAAAVAVAHDNARRLALSDRAPFVVDGWEGGAGAYDLVLCNPPYIREDAILPREVARSSRRRRCSPARTGSTPIARSRRCSPPASRRRCRLRRDRARPGRGRRRAAYRCGAVLPAAP